MALSVQNDSQKSEIVAAMSRGVKAFPRVDSTTTCSMGLVLFRSHCPRDSLKRIHNACVTARIGNSLEQKQWIKFDEKAFPNLQSRKRPKSRFHKLIQKVQTKAQNWSEWSRPDEIASSGSNRAQDVQKGKTETWESPDSNKSQRWQHTVTLWSNSLPTVART